MARQRSPETAPAPSRVFKGQVEIFHDLFVLSTAKMLRDTSYNQQPSEDTLIPVDHQHFFHTVDSNGKKQTTCSPIGGHFHVMELISEAEGDKPATYRCGPPVKIIKQKVAGKFRDVAVPIAYDFHTHDVVYHHSGVIKMRVGNAEAARAVPAPPPVPAGVLEG